MTAKNNRAKNNRARALLVVIALIALLALTVALILQAAWLHNAEVNEQIAKFGFYKEDVLLNYGRDVARMACILGAVLSGVSALSGFVAIIDQKLSIDNINF